MASFDRSNIRVPIGVHSRPKWRCIVFETVRDTDRKSRFVHTQPAFDAPLKGPRRNFAVIFRTEKLEWWGYHNSIR